MEAAEAEALNCWEQMQPWRTKIREAKMNLATCQGRLYALLELGFKLPNNLESAVQEQRRMWMEERQQTEALMEKQSELVYQRRERKQLFQREQGWRKAVERFGGLLGLGPEALLAVRLQILESDEVEMRTVSKARVRVLDNSVKVHEVASAELHGATGAIGFLSQFKERVPTDDILRAEEYEASLELQMIKGALQEIKPKTDEALHLRLGWQSAVGGHKIADLLASPDLASMAEALSDAQEPWSRPSLLDRRRSHWRHSMARYRGGYRPSAPCAWRSRPRVTAMRWRRRWIGCSRPPSLRTCACR